MKRVLGIAMVLGLMSALTIMAQDVKPGKGAVKGKSGKAQVKANPGKIEVVDLGKNVKLEMVLIPAGKFLMGSPAHEVTLTKPFYMGKYEVTQEQWFEIMGKNPSEDTGRMLPVTNVSWNDCHFFIRKLNDKTKGGYRLPTEAEWEYSCRAGTTTDYSFGDKITTKDANYFDSKTAKPVAVGSYKPNAFGLYDMHGNVWKWCEDWYSDGYPEGAVTDPKGPTSSISRTGGGRVLRGGSFGNAASNARSSYRYCYPPTYGCPDFGFRLVRTP